MIAGRFSKWRSADASNRLSPLRISGRTRLEEIPKPTPADGEVLIRVHAASVNPYDWHFFRGTPSFIRLFTGMRRPKSPRLGADVARVVVSVGAKVAPFKPGDAVFGTANSFAESLALAHAACREAARDFVRTSRMFANRGDHRAARRARQRKSSDRANRPHERCSGRCRNLCLQIAKCLAHASQGCAAPEMSSRSGPSEQTK